MPFDDILAMAMEDAAARDDIVRIETPEHVVFEYELAGLGTRLVAAAVDGMLVGLGLLGLGLVTVLVAGGLSELAPYAIASAIVSAFVLFWGYPILFELYMGGQTPGKRSLGIRVIQEGGTALTPAAVVVRNLLRLVDFLPGGYFLGVVVMMLNRRYKRIGDFVAGTIVIRERLRSRSPVRVPTQELSPARNEAAAADLRRAGVHRLSPAQVQLLEDFLGRRRGLEPAARHRLADQLSRTLMEQLRIQEIPGERFLQSLLLAHRRNEEQGEGGAPPPRTGA